MTTETKPTFIEYINSLNDSVSIQFIEKYTDADVVLIPTRKVVYVRGNRRLKGHIDRTFRGLDRLASSLAYVDGLSRAIATISNIAPIPSQSKTLSYGIRLD